MIVEGVLAWQLIFIFRVVNDLKYCSEIYRLFPGASCIVEWGDITTLFVSGNPIIISLLASTLWTGVILAFSGAGYTFFKLALRALGSRGKKNEGQ